MNVQRIGAVVSKETREIIRDPIAVWISVLLPLVMLFLFGYAVNLDVDEVGLGVLDEDKTPASRALTDRLVQHGYFRLARSLVTESDIEPALQKGLIKLAIVIPVDFHAKLVQDKVPAVQILADGTYSATALIAVNYAQTIVSEFRYGAETPVYTTAPAARLEIRVWYNAAMRSINYIVPGLFGVILMAFPPLLTALAIVREKETGSIQQIFVSPLTPAEFITGKLIPYGLIAFLQMVMVIAVGFLWFEVPVRGNVGFLLAAALIYVFCTVGIGLLISTITRKQVTAMLLALIVTLMPSFLFSGFLFPIFTMPYVLQLYTYVFPSRYFVELSRGIVLKAGGLETLWFNVALMLLYTGVVFWLAVWRFRKKVA